MTILVTGSAGHLGEAVVRSLRAAKRPVRGVDIKVSAFTDLVGSIRDRNASLAQEVGSKGYHDGTFAEGPYPAE